MPAGARLRRTARSILFGTVFLAGAMRLSGQQRVVGEVLDGSSGAPIEGAMVLLVVGERTLASVLTAADGSFALLVDEPGSYRLRVDRIGFASTLSDAFGVAAGSTVRRRVRTEVQAVRLEGLEVSGARRCSLAPEQGTPTAAVWEEARKALAAATWTIDREMYRLSWIRFSRDLDGGSGRVTAERRQRTRAYTARPFQSIDLDELAATGFMRPDGDGFVFHGPDAEVLLSEFFLRGHCLSVVRDDEDRDAGTRIGLRFEPVAGSRLPDIDGTIWLDEASGRLRSVEYDYVNLGRRAPVEGDDASGRLVFRELPNGTWIVEDWHIRMPLLAERRGRSGAVEAYSVQGWREEGGSVTSVATRTGLMLDGVVTGFHGTVTDSLGEPAAGATVWIVGTGLETTTDEDGVFSLTEVGAGRWAVRASHPGLGAYGFRGTEVEVSIERNQLRPLRLGLPSARSVLTTRCEGRPDGVLAGRVTSSAGDPVGGAMVRTTWSRRGTTEGLAVPSDGQGVFVVCGVPTDVELRAEATVDTTSAEAGPAANAVVGEDGFALIELGVQEDDLARRGAVTLGVRDTFLSEASAEWLRSVGFEARRARALGSYMGAEVARADSVPALLAQIPGLVMRRSASGYTTLHRRPADAAPRDTTTLCEIRDFYVNGSLVEQRIQGNWEAQIVRRFPPRRVAGLEVFTGPTAPVGPPDACGAVLFWAPLDRTIDDPDFLGGLSGEIVAAEGHGVGGSAVRAVPGDLRADVDAQGRFSFGSIPPGTYRLEVTLPEWGSFEQEVSVRAYAHSAVRIEVGPRDAAGPGAVTAPVSRPLRPEAARAASPSAR